MVDKHLFELIEDLALVMTQADQRQDILKWRRGRFIANASLELRETIGIESKKNILRVIPLSFIYLPSERELH